MKRLSQMIFLSPLALAFVSCVTMPIPGTVTESVREERVSNRAKWDLECNDGTIKVQKIDDVSYTASGCGKEALYLMDKCHNMNWASVCAAVRNGEVRPVTK